MDEPGAVQDSAEDASGPAQPAQPAAELESASALARAASASSAGSAPAAKPKVKGPAKLMMELFPAGSKPDPAPSAISTPAAPTAPVAQARTSQEAPPQPQKPAAAASRPQPSAAKPQPSAAKAPAQQPDSPPRQPSTPPARPSPSPQASAQQQQPQAVPSQPAAAAPAPPAGLTFPSSSEPAAPSTPRLSQPPQLTPSNAALVQAASEALQGVLHTEVIVGTQQTVAEYHAEAAKSAFGVQVEHLRDPGSARAQPTALFLYDFSSRQLHGLWLSEPSHSKRFPSVRLPALLP